MNLEELITNIFKKINEESSKNFTKADIRLIYKTFIACLEEYLEKESESLENKREIKINLPLIGKLNIVRQNSYIGRNPKTKEKIKIESSNRIYFSPYKSIKKSVNKNK